MSQLEFVTPGLVLTVAGADLVRKLLNPAAEEMGALIKDAVVELRQRCLDSVLMHAKKKLEGRQNVHPPLMMLREITEHASWIDDSGLQEMWGGLLASSCNEDGSDDGNLLFANLLKQLSPSQARIINHVVPLCGKEVRGVLVVTRSFGRLHFRGNELFEIAGITDPERLDREIDHLRSLDLISDTSHASGDETPSEVTPLPLAMYLYVRCQGSRQSLIEFFGMQSGEPTFPPTNVSSGP